VAKVNAFQTGAKALGNEESVADSMARDVRAGGVDAPHSFHLGDIEGYAKLSLKK
jgi:hypothetical protein